MDFPWWYKFESFLWIAIFWFAMAIPTSLIARRLGHSRWVSYVVWCPFIAVVLLHLIDPLIIRLLPIKAWLFIDSMAFLVPGVLYLWFLALK
jgi:hypothetical protein